MNKTTFTTLALILSFSIPAFASSEKDDVCNFQDNRRTLDNLDKKVIHQLSKLYTAKSISEGKGLLRANRSVTKLSHVAGKKHDVKSAFMPLEKTILECIEQDAYTFAERNAMEAMLDTVSSDIEKLETDYATIRETILDQALSH